MQINSDINILGSLQDWDLIRYFYEKKNKDEPLFTHIKTDKSVKRFESGIKHTFLTFKNHKIETLFDSLISHEGISQDFLYFLFWNTSLNNDLFDYINREVFFKAFYSGRVSIRKDEVAACLNDLKEREKELTKWTVNTIQTTASKYLTLLKKFGLLEGSTTKNIVYPFLNEKMFVIFIYFLNAIEETTNILDSNRLIYSFMEKTVFIERIKEKRFAKYFDIYYTGDKLKAEIKIPYKDIYNDISSGN